jgi:tRNA(Ile)-lysidine synthase
LTIPGEVVAAAFGLRLRIEFAGSAVETGGPLSDAGDGKAAKIGRLRNWRAGDSVRLRYSSGPRKVKEVLERLRVTGSSRALWPVLEVEGRIVWMKGVELEPEGIQVEAVPLN